MIDIEVMEDQMLLALQGIAELKHIDSYQGDINDATMSVMKLPAVLTVYSGAVPEAEINIDSVKAKIKVSFSVFVIGKNLSGKKEASSDVRGILKKVREKLNGLRYERRVLLWQQESLAIMTNTRVCVYEQVYQYTDYLVQ